MCSSVPDALLIVYQQSINGLAGGGIRKLGRELQTLLGISFLVGSIAILRRDYMKYNNKIM